MKTAGKYLADGIIENSSPTSGVRSKESVFRILSPVLCILSFGLYGCSVGQYFQRQELSVERLSVSYYQTKLKTSSSLDVLRMIRASESELGPRFAGTHLLGQSDTAIASMGQSKDGYKTWFTIVAFDENNMTAKRKHFYLVDEKAVVKPTDIRHFQIVPKPGLMFDSEMILPAEVLDRPYVTREARQIAALKQVAEELRKDVDELSQDNQTLAVSGMLINQVFKTVLLELDRSPLLAENLSDKNGVQFNHSSFDKGRIYMTIEDSVVTVKIRLGVFMRSEF